MKKISIFGFTGNLGTQALDILKSYKNEFEFDIFVCDKNLNLAESVVREFNPKYIFFSCEEAKKRFKNLELDVEVLDCIENVTEKIENNPSDIFLSAVSSYEALELTIAAAKSGKKLLLANKESLVIFGKFIMDTVSSSGTELIPIDSEHFSLFSSLSNLNKNDIKKIFITASGGPFLGQNLEQIKNKKAVDALKHPTWKMGDKITIDSATLINKCFELIEAKFLFDLDPEKLDILIQPQSIIHSLIELNDGSVEAQLSKPSMIIPLSYGLLDSRSEEVRNKFSLNMFEDEINLQLKFFPEDRKELLKITREIMNLGGNRGLIFATLNQIAVNKFLKDQIKFGDIYEFIYNNYFNFEKKELNTLEELRSAHKEILEKLN
ncbi:1-deoxy-D-xylulose-5-phosphate reductoisomerase [SAR86 cluster bacterium]|jgi:1-deoxy-D-xylulose-5-phosphate reductoisomerase|uniref:1-deoxy-D-xylulose 5-phosphate reductoisomerase n=1 Tax=SAR86 cluster bacterium TaxID=2030880 RepID=A0A9Q8TYN0_9GAMM|nr:1-deoxy-D-xylulose-5-phosphate reductoisomerase [SAR86 cluster bacterium]